MFTIGWSIVGLAVLGFVISAGLELFKKRLPASKTDLSAQLAFISIFLIVAGLLVVARAAGVNEI